MDASKVGDTRRAADLNVFSKVRPTRKHRLVISSLGVGPADVHNLAVLTRLPVLEEHNVRHSFVEPLQFRRHTALPPDNAAVPLMWDRPLQHLLLALPDGRHLHLFNVHLRAPLAAAVPGQKAGPFAWKTVSGWAEGFFAAAAKRAGQALRLRDWRSSACSAPSWTPALQFAATLTRKTTTPRSRLACAGEDDTGSGHLAGRVLTPVERTLPADRRFTVLHHGRPQMLIILGSRALFADFVGVEIHNEMLEDELVAYGRALIALRIPVCANRRDFQSWGDR